MDVKRCRPFGEVWRFLRMLNVKVSHDPAVSLLGVNPGAVKTHPNKKSYMDFHSKHYSILLESENNPSVHQLKNK